jgi:hypothetical protein
MLAVQLIGRLLPHAEASLNISSLLQQAHRLGPEHCALGDQASHCKKKPCRNAPNSDVDNGGAEPNNVGVGIIRPPCRLVRATVAHIEISRSFFYSADNRAAIIKDGVKSRHW